MPRIAVGGTFEFLHDGHKMLLNKAFEIAKDGPVDIGVTSDAMAQHKRSQIPDYDKRVIQLEKFLDSIHIKKEAYTIRKLDDPCGTTLTGNYDCIVVSPETFSTALRINDIRKRNGLAALTIVKIDYVLAEDNIPISSTRIVNGEIDIHGHLNGTRL